MKILNFGSLNIDYVYKVPHFVQPGETISSSALETFAGGKGANQSVALARAGAQVFHAGKIGRDGRWLKEELTGDGVDTTYLFQSDSNNGHAIIQVDESGQNAIVLFAGANKEITKEEIDQTFSYFDKGDFLLLQNEINHVDYLIQKGHEKGLKVCFNPAPMTQEVHNYPLDLVDLFILNETESANLAQTELVKRFPNAEVILTLGKGGASYYYKEKHLHVPAREVKVVDTTAAGDTFIGYYLAAMLEGQSAQYALNFATEASALCVTRKGAQPAIPLKSQLLDH